ncbi:MAG: trypsin-like peptidase domain-containing protein [Phycisphaerae bacterium]|nr:trypsin-like peptidase domain-containing protein [Phycisphaerae bacterium]
MPFRFHLLPPILLLVACCAVPTLGAADDCAALAAAHSATARLVAANGDTGTGTVFEVSQGRVFLATAAHVATSQTLQAQFFFLGHESKAVPAALLWRDEPADLAIVAVNLAALEGTIPPAIPLAPPDAVVPTGAPIYTVGCAHGAWATGAEGHAIGYDEGRRLCFLPIPAEGRSGSAVIHAGRIVGIVSVQVFDKRKEEGGRPVHGAAAPHHAFYALWGNAQQKTAARLVEIPTQAQRWQPFGGRLQGMMGGCQGGGCPGGQCPYPQQPAPQQTPQPSPNAGGVWPTRPDPAAEIGGARAASLDLAQLAEAIHGPPEERDLRRRLLEAQLAQLEAQSQAAADAKAEAALEAVPRAQLADAAGSAVTGQWSEAAATLTGPEVAGWAVGSVATLALGWLGLRGLPGLLARWLIGLVGAAAFRWAHARITAPVDTEVDAVIRDVTTKVKPASHPQGA